MLNIRTVVFLTFILTNVYSLEITTLENPFLPINLGSAKLIYTNHIFIHYFNYLELESQLDNIYSNIRLIKIACKNLTTESSTISKVLTNISSNDLDFTYNQLLDKYNNIRPSVKPRRIRRGLINPIGNLYNAAFGLLDAEDGERLETAINNLSKNQKNLYTSLDKQMSLSSKLIDRLNNSLTIIANNQRNITNHINAIGSRYDTFIMTSLRLLTLQEIKRHITANCITLIDLIDQLETAIMFAHLNTIHPSIIHSNEIQEMLTILQNYYDQPNIIFFESILSYYKLLTTQVFFENGRIIFTVNFPLVTDRNFKLYQIIPIPLHNIITYPTTFHVLSAPEETLMVQERCPIIETTSYCPPEFRQADKCMLATLSSTPPTACSQRQITLRTTLTQKIENNLIIVPKPNDTLKTVCNSQEQITQLKKPALVKLTNDCTVEIDKRKFDATKQKFSTLPLILPKIEMPEMPELPKYQPIEIHDPELEKIQDLKNLIRHPDPLIPINITAHTYASLIITLALIITIAAAYLFYRRYGCTCLKRRAKLTQIVAAQLSQVTDPPINHTVEMQPLQTIAKPIQPMPAKRHSPEMNTAYPRL